ncbi:hypothetical protein E1281_14030 [Actinomadura sp. KC345]|uniref:hypothetical protein n=1 Tax=Actinomadura sp. KC345 TaxID=2530371 RepID=UPI00104C8EED|nr:hypothetical protein [Actinomadura sp. KC345]TDC55129.1 hypothetical protein E1281_14030 [Actinomadura sp. KC345]
MSSTNGVRGGAWARRAAAGRDRAAAVFAPLSAVFAARVVFALAAPAAVSAGLVLVAAPLAGAALRAGAALADVPFADVPFADVPFADVLFADVPFAGAALAGPLFAVAGAAASAGRFRGRFFGAPAGAGGRLLVVVMSPP